MEIYRQMKINLKFWYVTPTPKEAMSYFWNVKTHLIEQQMNNKICAHTVYDTQFEKLRQLWISILWQTLKNFTTQTPKM